MIRVQTRLLLLLIALSGLFLCGLLIIRHLQNTGIASFMAERRVESNLLLDKLITLKGNTLFSFSYDYTYWDEMVEFVRTGDSNWAYENIDVVLPTYKVNGVWIFRPDYSLAYLTQPEGDDLLPALPALIETIPQIFVHHRLVHFFVDTPQGLMEIRGATIHPTADVNRVTPPAGYFFAGRLWNQAELDDLSDLVGGIVTLVRPGETEAPEETGSDGTITLYRPLNSWDGRPLAQLRVDIPSPVTQLAVQMLNRDFVLYTIFVVLLSVVIFVLLTAWVIVPLKQIASSLDTGDAAPIQNLKTDKTEFGHVAQLIDQSFRQKAELIAEIAERRRAEESLRQERDFSEAVLDSLPDLFFMLDDQGRPIRRNKRSEEIGGYTAEEIARMNFSDFFDGEDKERIADKFRQAFTEGKADVAAYYVTKNGQRIPYYLTGWRKTLGAKTYLIGFGVDLTERKRLEAQLRQAQKMDAIGRLAGGVAHDFNNLLTVITGYTDLLLARCTHASDSERRDLEQIKRSANRAASLTRQLLAFSRQQVLQPTILDLSTVVAEMSKMLSRLIGEDIELVTVLRPQLGRVRADLNQIEQIIMNLAVNARDAMPRGGKLTIETANVELDEAYTRLHLEVTPGSYVMLAVSDTGHGMDKETQAHIFEPFFTTKEVGQGTGLGLATVHGVVTQSGGHIWLYSEPGQGTTFKIYLPQVAVEKAVAVEPARLQPSLGTETILVVEDEESLRELTHRVLTREGYTVLMAQNGPEALTLCKHHRSPIHLLLTDMIMPNGLNGSELARYLLAIHPMLKVIYMSGYTDNALIERSLLASDAAFLQKPFTPDKLVGKLREVLDQT